MIQVENLTKTFGDLCAVDHITLDILRRFVLAERRSPSK
jgi:ABC-type branched-subunit amino acid transport system ATPase component